MIHVVKTVVGLFDDFEGAGRAVAALLAKGYERADISLIAPEAVRRQRPRPADATGDRDVPPLTPEDMAGVGAVLGASVGGVVGILGEVGSFVIPGIGPLLALGPILTALAGSGVGAGVGALVGILMQAGVPEHDAALYVQAVRRGETLVMVRADDVHVLEVVAVLAGHGACGIEERRSSDPGAAARG